MSLERAALRLAATMALSNGFAAPYPTIAQGRVFDSRQDPIEGLTVGSIVPTIILYTDDDSGMSLSANNGGPPFLHQVSLVMELTLGIAEADETGAIGITLPYSEPELDATLDAFEAQVSRVFQMQAGPWGELLGKCLLKIDSWSSTRFVDREANIRLASRQITASVKLPLPRDQIVIDPTAPATPYIPEPYGSALSAVAGSNSPYAPTAQAIIDLILSGAPDVPIRLPRLERVRFIETNQSRVNGAGVPAGPRPAGVAEADLT